MTTRNSHGHRAGWQPTDFAQAGLATVAGPSSATCAFIIDLAVTAALDVVLPADEIALARHVAACRSCAADLAELGNVAAWLGAAVPQIEPSAALCQRVIEAALRETVAQPALARNKANPGNGAAHADH